MLLLPYHDAFEGSSEASNRMSDSNILEGDDGGTGKVGQWGFMGDILRSVSVTRGENKREEPHCENTPGYIAHVSITTNVETAVVNRHGKKARKRYALLTSVYLVLILLGIELRISPHLCVHGYKI